MDAHNTVTVEEGDRYPSGPPTTYKYFYAKQRETAKTIRRHAARFC
jgi:hypothetical protein